MKVHVIILNYNGKELLTECLPSILEALKASRHKCAVTVLDNQSTDNSVEFLRKEFPSLNVCIAKTNKVLCSYNEFVRTIDDDLILLLNNDIKLDKNFIDPMVDVFLKEKNVFFVAAQGFWLKTNSYGGDRAKVKLDFGIIESDVWYSRHERDILKPGYTLCAGVGMFDRGKFVMLGGYDDLYLPGRYEDVDLCYRGWKCGYKGIYQPRSILYHYGGASFQRDFLRDAIYETVFRNSMLFMIKNVSDPLIWLQCFVFLPMRLTYYLLTGRLFLIRGFLAVFGRLNTAIEKRKRVMASFKCSDREVILKINRMEYHEW